MCLEFADIIKNIVFLINRGCPGAVYDLPYALTSTEIAELIEVVDKAPISYSLTFNNPAPLTHKLFTPVFQFEILNLEDDD